MDTDCMNFCQKDFVCSSFASFEIMKESGELVDFKVTIQDRTFFAHRLVLAAGIPYWRNTFANSVTEIPIERIDPDIFEDVINFAYTGRMKITMGNVQSLLTASHFFQMSQVYEACVKFMSFQINANNAFRFRESARKVRSLGLSSACDRYILRNFDAFARQGSEEILQLSFPDVKEILSSDDLNVAKEEIVFETAMKWVEASPAERHGLLPELLPAIRLTRLSIEYLVETVSSEKLILSSAPSRYLVEQAKDYHLLPKKCPSWLNTRSRSTRDCGMYAICSSDVGQFVEQYDLVKGVWIPLAKINSKPVIDAAGFKGKLYFLTNNSKEIGSFDTKTFETEQLEISLDASERKRTAQRIVFHDRMLYLFTYEEMYCFDPQEKKCLGLKASMQSEDSGIASLGQYIYITGGWIRGTISVSKRYSPTLDTRSEISPMLKCRRLHGCAALNDKLYVCGGTCDESEMYDPLTDQWSYISSLKTALPDPSLVPYDGKLYIWSYTSAEIYDPGTGEWSVNTSVPSLCQKVKSVSIPPYEELRK